MSTYVLGEFKEVGPMLEAARKLRESGEQDLDAYTPYPVHGASEALGLPKSKVPLYALIGGLTGACTAVLMQWWMNASDYPINVGGRPMVSLPSWVPITFELGVLFAAFAIFFGSLGMFGLPRPYHPVFESDQFRRASIGTFWVSVGTGGDATRAQQVHAKLQELGAATVDTVTDASALEGA